MALSNADDVSLAVSLSVAGTLHSDGAVAGVEACLYDRRANRGDTLLFIVGLVLRRLASTL